MVDISTKLEVPCGGCSIDPCYHWPYCTELISLRAEVERLREERDRFEQRVVDYVHALGQLRAFVQKVALYSNDAWLAREADELAPGASL